MNKKTILLDGNRFSTLQSFYEEVEKKCTKDLSWSIGRNLNALNDVLRGGFGVHDYEEKVQLIWLSSDKSRHDLGWEEMVNYLSVKLTTCHPSNTEAVKIEITKAKNHTDQTLFELIVALIQEHEHIDLLLQ